MKVKSLHKVFAERGGGGTFRGGREIWFSDQIIDSCGLKYKSP